MGLNSITILGRLVRDPELRRTGSGTAVASFTVAVDRDFAGQDGVKATDFFDCVAWKSTAEFACKYFSKGSLAAVRGRMQARDWTDKSGGKRRSWEIQVDNLYFGGSKADNQSSQQRQAGSYGGYPETQAAIDRYRKTGPEDPAPFAILEDEDEQLPFSI